MKITVSICLAILFLTGCGGVNKQVNQIKALENCKYEVGSADSIYLAGLDVKEIIAKKDFNILKLPGLAFAFMRQNVPLKARLNLVINNPSNKLAAINQFEYKVLIKNRELAGGFVNQKIAISPNGGRTEVPIDINTNIYGLLADDKAMAAISDFMIEGGDERKERKGVITFKIKPTLDFGNRQIKYPGFITIDKEISSKHFF